MSKPPEGCRPLCVGCPEQWEATTGPVADQAVIMCGVCPAREWCDREARHALDAGLPISGVWAGVAYANGSQVTTNARTM